MHERNGVGTLASQLINKRYQQQQQQTTHLDFRPEVFQARKRNYCLEIRNSISHHDPEAHLRGNEFQPSLGLFWALYWSRGEEQALFSENWAVRIWYIRCICRTGCQTEKRRHFMLSGHACKMQEAEFVKANTCFVSTVPYFIYDSVSILLILTLVKE